MWFYRIFLPPTIFNTDSLNICNKDIIKLIIANFVVFFYFFYVVLNFPNEALYRPTT